VARLLNSGAVLAHPWVVGEFALGNLSHRAEVIGLLRGLPQATVASNNEVLTLIEQEALHDTGIGYVDAQHLAATRLTLIPVVDPRQKVVNLSAQLGLDFPPSFRPGLRS
jgi:hypothetical protein